jgi:hypothetical protein
MVLQYKQAAEEQKASLGKGSSRAGNNPLPPSGSGKTTHTSNSKKPSNPLTKK